LGVNGGDYHLRSITVDGDTFPALRGNGAVGPVTVKNGVISPAGKLTVTGKLTLDPDAVFEPAINNNGPGSAGQLEVKGPVALANATLRPMASVPPDVGTVFTIVSNQGGAAVSGTFSGLPEGSVVTDANNSSITYRISYTGGASGRDVTLTALNPTFGPEADLAVTQTASPDPVAVGGKARFDITVTNHGTVPANVSLHDQMPAGTTLVSLSQLAGWSCRTGTGGDGRGINCTSNAQLATGSTQTFTLIVRVRAGAAPTASNEATVSGDVADPDLSNNTSVATVAVV